MGSVSPLVARRLASKVALIAGGASGIGESTARPFCRHAAKVFIADVQDEKGRSVCNDIGEELTGKVALITGGASGIGEATARLFYHHGAKVVIADIQDEKGRSVCDDIGKDSASFIHCDVTNESEVQEAVDHAVNTYGKLDIMFNNAGVLGLINHQILNTDISEFERIMTTNVIGVFLGTKHAARVMMPEHKGSIIINGSVSSVRGGCGNYPYTCSKHAVVGLMKDAAAELGKHGIRVNCVSPYGVATPMAMDSTGGTMSVAELEAAIESNAKLKGVLLKAEDVASAALFLASDDAKYVSGHNLLVDGGLTVS